MAVDAQAVRFLGFDFISVASEPRFSGVRRAEQLYGLGEFVAIELKIMGVVAVLNAVWINRGAYRDVYEGIIGGDFFVLGRIVLKVGTSGIGTPSNLPEWERTPSNLREWEHFHERGFAMGISPLAYRATSIRLNRRGHKTGEFGLAAVMVEASVSTASQTLEHFFYHLIRQDSLDSVSYTHLTLPTTPYV